MDDDPSNMEDQRIGTDSLRTEMVTTDNAVRVAPGPESAPTFDETGTVTREVAENTAPGGNVGAPVAAMAANTDETLIYTLEGSDAKYFNIDQMGQITVGGDAGEGEGGTDPELDYDDPAKQQRFSVTVKIEVMSGDANQNAEVDVVIIVTDVDESPVITDEDVDKPPMTEVDYPEIDENDAPNTAAVASYVGTDPEGDTISWDLRGADAALFTIDDDGVLKFRNAPDFEDPKDVGDADGLTATPGATASDNTYNIVIRAIASRARGDTGPAETVDTTVAVTVMNVDEDGEVVISWLQPEAGTEITASLTDPDGDVPDETWQWAVSKVSVSDLKIGVEAHWVNAPGTGNGSATYTPADSDATPIPRYLRVTASYSDETGDKMARMMSANPVQAMGGGSENGSPDFVDEKVDRGVAETADVGDDVGNPVTAPKGGSSAKDRLTYGLRAFATGDVGSTGLEEPVSEVATFNLAAFAIDQASGQITVARKLNFERGKDTDDPSTANDGKYVVVATVTDPSGEADFIVVVITAEDINEDPVLEGRSELTINEIDSSNADAANPDFDGQPEEDPVVPTVNVYKVSDVDQDSGTGSWGLEGEGRR